MRSSLLAPLPQSLEAGPGAVDLAAGLSLGIDPAFGPLDSALETLRTTLGSMSIDLRVDQAGATPLEVRRDTAIAHPEGYRLEVGDDRLLVVASEPAGAFYGLRTLTQWLALEGRPGADPSDRSSLVSHLRVSDWPDLPHRGVLLDISRSRVPTMETLCELVDLLSGWKINQLQLYTEHTFAYRGHEEVWAEASPLTPAEVRNLDAYCADRHIELVPNQNSFGHLHRWLRHPRYRSLAECPDGLEHPFGDATEPFSLCPTDPGSLDLLRDLYAQLLPCFSSQQVNVGLDETFDLGRGRSAERAAEIGVGRIYLDFLLEVHRLAGRHGRRVQFWGDILANHAELIDELPKDVVVMSWGYEADHPFAEEIEPLRQRQLDVYVCPGTSSWLSFAGRIDNAVTNIANAVGAAVDARATGCLVTDWGDRGHLQPLPFSFPGFLAAACLSWNASGAKSPGDLSLAAKLDAHAFAGIPGGLAEPLVALGNLYRATGAGSFNGSPLFHLVTSPELALSHSRLAGLSVEALEDCRKTIARVNNHLDGTPDSLSTREVRWTAEALDLGVAIGAARLRAGADASAVDLSTAERRRLAAAYEPLLAGHGPLWAARSRPGGASESRAVLDQARATLGGTTPNARPPE